MAIQRFGSGARAALGFLVLMLALVAKAFPPTYGAEFEFTNMELHQGTGSRLRGREAGAARAMALRIHELCLSAGCSVEEIKGKWESDYRVKFRDGWYFVVSYDPLVVEVQTKPSTLEELRAHRELMNRLIFSAAQDVGLSPHESKAGHFNVGVLSAFGNDPKLFLRYFVDYANHAELAYGIFRKEMRKSPPLAALPVESHEALREIIAEVEAGRLRTVAEVAVAIDRRVYTSSLAPPEWGASPQHNQALAVNKISAARLDRGGPFGFFFGVKVTDQPFEIRAMKAQNSADDFILLAELFEKRLEFLRRQTGAIRFEVADLSALDGNQAVRRFRGYLQEAGVDLASYRALLLPSAQSDWDAMLCGPLFRH